MTCIDLQGKERADLLKGLGEENERYWLKVDDEDGFVLSSVVGKLGDKAGGGVKVMRLHAPLQTNLREVVTDKKFATLKRVGVGKDAIIDWGEIVDDLVDLEDEALEEPCVLHTLRMRYHHGPEAIFTAVGDVLLIVNPFKPVGCCSEGELKKLMAMDLTDVPPHIVRTARGAYAGMVEGGSPQSILVSGESGAGKTETTKLVLQSIAMVSASSGRAIEAALASSPLLEAFGNSTTVHNRNSSRFGKWLVLYFDKRARITACNVRRLLLFGALPSLAPRADTCSCSRDATCQVSHFLLEQGRIVSPPPAERNFHIFYFLLAGQSTPGDPSAYAYSKKRPRLDGVKKVCDLPDLPISPQISPCVSPAGPETSRALSQRGPKPRVHTSLAGPEATRAPPHILTVCLSFVPRCEGNPDER